MKTKTFPKVQNLISPNGNEVPNQFCIIDGDKRVFQSYSSVIAVIERGTVTLDADKWNYSNTTSKYRNQFLGLTTKETEKKIKAGEITLTNLN